MRVWILFHKKQCIEKIQEQLTQLQNFKVWKWGETYRVQKLFHLYGQFQRWRGLKQYAIFTFSSDYIKALTSNKPFYDTERPKTTGDKSRVPFLNTVKRFKDPEKEVIKNYTIKPTKIKFVPWTTLIIDKLGRKGFPDTVFPQRAGQTVRNISSGIKTNK